MTEKTPPAQVAGDDHHECKLRIKFVLVDDVNGSLVIEKHHQHKLQSQYHLGH